MIKKQPREIIWSALLRMSEQAPFYIFTAFIFAYAVGTLKMDRNFILSAVMVAACVSFFTIPLAGHFSDLIGRKKMYLIGVVAMGLFGFLYFGMVDTAVPALVFIAIVLSLIPHDMQYGPQAALIAEAFTPRLRYSGASLGYQLASIIAGGPAPLIATCAVRDLPLGLCDLDLYRRPCRHQLHRDFDDAGLHRQGHFGRRIQRRLADACPRGERKARCRAKTRARFQRCWDRVFAFMGVKAPRRFADRSGACGPCRRRAASVRPDRWRCRDRPGRRLPGRRR